jgi:hypothetical protein
MTFASTCRGLAVVALLAGASPAWAQFVPMTGAPAASQNGASAPASRAEAPASNATSFDSMMAGDRKIARALFLAQRPTPNGPSPLSLNQIADLKAHDSWAKVFKQMQAQGLIRADNLGQVVSAYERQLRSDALPPGAPRRMASAAATPSHTTLVTNGRGEVIASSRSPGAGIQHGGGSQVQEDNKSAVAVVSSANHDR